ncbi:MAG: Fe-S cluster protein [Deltaproteobacteria bacterium]|nr:Fe-S cluster protein [Deltaproteobacteria bacterium]
MLLENYELEVFNSKCNPSAMSVHCFAHLGQDVSAALPYLNTLLGGFEYLRDPPSVTFKVQGKLITVHGRKIAVNALKDEAEARKIIEWLKREINDAWDRRDQIAPSVQATPRPGLLDILKLLPKTNCKACGEPTCMVFAARVAEGAKGSQDCPELIPDARSVLDGYLGQFHFPD